MTKLKRKDKRREEEKAYKLVKKFGVNLESADVRRLGENAYLLDLVLKKLGDKFKANPDAVKDEEDLAYCCLQVAKHVFANEFTPDVKALGLMTIAHGFDKLYPDAPDDNVHMKLVKHGLRHIREHMEPMIPKTKWMKYGVGKKR